MVRSGKADWDKTKARRRLTYVGCPWYRMLVLWFWVPWRNRSSLLPVLSRINYYNTGIHLFYERNSLYGFNNLFFIYLIANHLLALSNVRLLAISWNTISSISPPASTQPGTATEGEYSIVSLGQFLYVFFTCFLLSKSILTCIFLVLLFSLCRRRKPHTPTSSKGTKGL